MKIQVLGDEKPLVLQENHYYPFGMNMKGIENEPEKYHKFQYNGKEKEVDLGLNLYDYHARMQDPQLGIFRQIDPLNQYSSGYVYVGNNPILMIDPTGMYGIKSDFLAKTVVDNTGRVIYHDNDPQDKNIYYSPDGN